MQLLNFTTTTNLMLVEESRSVMKNVVHDLSELRKILQRFETVFLCLFGSPIAGHRSQK